MSDISLPPEAQKPQPPKQGSSGIRSLLMLVALVAPLPLLVSGADLWLSHTAEGQAMKETPFELIRQILNGSGDPPIWLLPLSLLPSFIVLMILGRNTAGRVIAAFILLLFAAGEFMLVGQMGEGLVR